MAVSGYAATVAGLSIAFPAARWVLHHGLFVPIAQYMKPKALRDAPHTEQEKYLEKACESQWKLLVYTIFLVVGTLASYTQPWLRDTKYYWIGWPNHSMTHMMQLQYCLESSFYISSIAMLMMWEVRRKDFVAMCMHHAATVVLQGASYFLGFARVGCVIMLLHDVNDVLLETAKLLQYWRKEPAATCVFAFFTVVWLILRMGYFPFVIVRSTIFEQVAVLGYQPPYYFMFNGLLCLLVVLHVYWFGLILNVIRVKLNTGSAHDVREDDN